MQLERRWRVRILAVPQPCRHAVMSAVARLAGASVLWHRESNLHFSSDYEVIRFPCLFVTWRSLRVKHLFKSLPTFKVFVLSFPEHLT